MAELKPKLGRKELRMQNKESQSLRKCPFCGGEAVVLIVPISGVCCVQCNSCPAIIGRKTKTISAVRGKEYFDTRESAVIAWNRRVDDGNL